MKTLLQLAVIAALCLPAIAQTATVPPLTVTIPARVVPAQTVTFTVPKNGGKVIVTIPAQTLPAQTSGTAATTAPVTTGGRHGGLLTRSRGGLTLASESVSHTGYSS
jgi:hypothetical protein